MLFQPEIVAAFCPNDRLHARRLFAAAVQARGGENYVMDG
jgi:hypothetical protein